jgi:hypothetical protein
MFDSLALTLPGRRLAMADPAPWISFQDQNKVQIIGSFENEFGERFVVWRRENMPYFTGDEVEWEPRNRLWPTSFRFSWDERAKIAKLLFRVPADTLTPAGLQQAPVTYGPDVEQSAAMIALRKQANVPTLTWSAERPDSR